LQTDVESIITRQLAALADKNVTSAAVVVLDAKNGDVLTMAGSADYFDDAHDGAVNVALSSRQPGSALKPFTYALGLSSGMTAATTVADTEARFLTQEGNPYTPRNYDFMYHGLVRLREALANSYNIAAVKVLEKVGVPSLLSFLQSTGITTLTDSPEHYGLALTLGDSEVKLLELSQAYGIFARLGRTLHIRTLLNDPVSAGTALLDPRVAWLISDILSDNDARTEQFGQTSALHFDFPVAAKTGTTRNSRDNWTIGFTPTRIVGVWVGNADNTPMKGTSGVTGAGPIFHDVMLAAMQNQPKEWLQKPDGIVDKVICRLSGKLMTPLCPSSLTEHFILGTEPKVYDDMYREVELDTRTDLLASDTCPKNQIKKEVFTFFPIELQRWARDNGWKQPPTDYSPLCPASTQSSHSSSFAIDELMITSPSSNAVFKMDPLIPDSSEKIFLEARAPLNIQTVEWFVDGDSVGMAKQPDFHLSWQISAGSHTIEVKSQEMRDTVTIKVAN
jgi:membrane carboxypeptidase/penicillin-binding protein PbpC